MQTTSSHPHQQIYLKPYIIALGKMKNKIKLIIEFNRNHRSTQILNKTCTICALELAKHTKNNQNKFTIY